MTVMDNIDTPRQMWEIARDHGHRYLLPRRFKNGTDPEKDRLYDIAGNLVRDGYARWIDGYSTFAPGVELTGKPWTARVR